MTNNVLITITSRHRDQKDSDAIQSVASGVYACIQGRHVVRYEEILTEAFDSEPAATPCILKIAQGSLSLVRRGQINTEMHFKPGESYDGYYDTPAGSMQMCLSTSRLDVTETEDTISVRLEYGLDLNYCHISDYCMKINISSKKD